MKNLFYHGTNLVAACHILRQMRIRADVPVDSEDGKRVVCLSRKCRVARAFAVEFARYNSRLPVGAVFSVDGRLANAMTCTSIKAETASFDEHEWRVAGDVCLRTHLVEVRRVGDTSRLNSARWLAQVYEQEGTGFDSFSDFCSAVAVLQRWQPD